MSSSQSFRSNDPSLCSWRTRDVVDELRAQRVTAAPTNQPNVVSPKSMSLSSHFDVDTCLARIRRDKAAVVRAAFDAAALTVVQAVDAVIQEENEGYDDDEDNNNNNDVDEDDLPVELMQWKKLEQARVACFERARDNKEVSKQKKGMKLSWPSTSRDAITSKKMAAAAAKTNNLTIPTKASTIGTNSSGVKKKAGSPDPNNYNKTNKKLKAAQTPARDSSAPKFTRNTPAASAAALDSRSTSSRAVLCTAANIAFAELTPSLPGHDVDVMDVPQNPTKAASNNNLTAESSPMAADNESDDPIKTTATAAVVSVNMGAVLLQAQTLGNRATAVAKNAARRAAQRYQYRKENAKYLAPKTSMLKVKNPFAWKEEPLDGEEDHDDDVEDQADGSMFSPSEDAATDMWETMCMPRWHEIMHTGVGHVIYHDLDWRSRHGRIANLLFELSQRDDNYGPHLIVTTEPELEYFAREFRNVNTHLQLLTTINYDALRMIHYKGSRAQRRKLRRYFPQAKGLFDDPFHVIITSYADFLQDYLHFCQMPFQVAVIDDGMALLAAAQGDLNSSLGTLWESAIWSANDQRIGLAGTTLKEWDFTKDEPTEDVIKEAWIGLTARYRVVTASNMYVEQRSSIDLVSVSGLVSLISPQFAEIVREEWDRSRIASDLPSLEHMRKLLSRSMVVHYPDADEDQDMYELALLALKGRLPAPDRSDDPSVPDIIPDESFVSEGKVTQSRRSALTWLGPQKSSWLRYELGTTSFQHILNAMKNSNVFGHVCQEITTASSTTSSGATGQVAGTLAFRLAVRCGRHFGSEPGLRQHMSALHAPPSTWLCRTCGGDCITSQARTHHERSCGQPTAGAQGPDNEGGPIGGGTPTVGQGVGSARGRQHHGPVGVVGKKKSKSGAGGAATIHDKDPDGSVRVPTYRGVWVNQAGKHFIKIDGKRFSEDEETAFFDTIEDAARKYDELVKSNGDNKGAELNYRDDGSRITHKEETPSSAVRGVEMLGGAADNVVPALSVINIKDLPPDIKPLLRDPRQTSRTGGNSKRHVYAYRGVCRQARKGHDRWQSQISFMGVNHYLGTFDSEWDAAAIYAWAHLILYGEEATKKAQREGEEAAAAYEQEKKDIAAGKIPDPPPKPEKKKRKSNTKSEKGSGDDKDNLADQKEANEEEESSALPKKKRQKDTSSNEKKPRNVAKIMKVDKESIVPLLAKGTTKVPILGPREAYRAISDDDLVLMVSSRINAFRKQTFAAPDLLRPVFNDQRLYTCMPVKLGARQLPSGGAMLLGVSSLSFGWSVAEYISSQYFESSEREEAATSSLTDEYDSNGYNESFRTVIQGTICVIGRSSKQSERFHSTMIGNVEIGGSMGKLDCNIGGTMKTCSDEAALIRYFPTTSSSFQFSAISEDDLVTLNGQRITASMGSFPLFNEDICTVGARVFVFLLPMDK